MWEFEMRQGRRQRYRALQLPWAEPFRAQSRHVKSKLYAVKFFQAEALDLPPIRA